MKKILYLVLLFGLSTMWVGCEKDVNNNDPFLYDGVSYEFNTGLNADKTAMYDSRDNSVYKVITVGSKKWMAENLRYETSGSWVNLENPDAKYGRLYDWTAANTSCPKGWHLPSDAEWKALESQLGMASADLGATGWREIAGNTSIKSMTGWAADGNGNYSDRFGINVFPAGKHESNSFKNLGDYAFFWTSTLSDGSSSWGRYLYRNTDKISRDKLSNASGNSCRCILD